MDRKMMDETGYLKAVLDAIPIPIFVMDENAFVVDINTASSHILSNDAEIVLRKPFGEILHCIHEGESVEGCGKTRYCGDCVVFGSVKSALQGNTVVKKDSKMILVEKDTVRHVHLQVTANPFQYNNTLHVLLCLEDITELTELRQILPICMVCKKVRDDDGYWQQVDTYLKKNLDMEFTHSVCPKCWDKLSSGVIKRH